MQIKKFRAKTIKQALEKVKKEFGTDAVILSAKDVQGSKNNIFNKQNNQIEITAAVDYNERIFNPIQDSEDQLTNNKIKNPFSNEKGSNQYPEQLIEKSKSTPQNLGPHHFRKNETLARLAIIFDHMLSQHINHGNALKITKQLWNIYRNPQNIKKENLSFHVSNILSEMGVGEKLIKLKKGKRRIVTFIGKSGVGKTISAIKVAALARRYLKNQEIGLISIVDPYTGSCQKAKTFADVVGYSHKVANNIIEFKHAVNEFKNKNLILVDTPGLVPGNSEKAHQIDQYLTQFYPMEIHMVLSANDKIENIRSNLGYLNQIPISHLLFTKLDETSSYGNILSMLINETLPLSYLSWGPDIPENIEKGSIKKIVDAIFQEINLKQSLNGDPESIAEIIHEFEKMLVDQKDFKHRANNSLPDSYDEAMGYYRQVASNY